MKKLFSILVLTFIFAGSGFTQPQLCKPDTAYSKKAAGIYPEAFHPRLNPKGGILDSACINKDYKYVFTVVVPDSFPTAFGNLKMDSIVIRKDGVIFAPKGITYSCNPPNCKFKGGTIGCIELGGKPTAENQVKIYDIKLKVKITVLSGIIVINDTLPDYITDSAHYYLPLFEENSLNCKTSAVDEFFADKVNLILSPNPSDDLLDISFDVPSTSRVRYSIMDITGKELFYNERKINYSRAIFTEDLSDLQTGIYLFMLKIDGKKLIRKFVVN
jgi:hypothetical protein